MGFSSPVSLLTGIENDQAHRIQATSATQPACHVSVQRLVSWR
ncbi:hypothetical protein [Trichocoleus sp. FACHB-90]|nr:hypothetical protein [Trichocoleus sp. FACHB-90]